ncbi:MAG: cob(I)yrinic acid a,c-diamide adenosyltransferase [Flavobacteriales bacterium]
MKIYTKKGDEGETSLFGGKKVPKYSKRIHAYGTIDELNSWLGLLRDQVDENHESFEILVKIQEDLFIIGSVLATEPEKESSYIPDLESGDIQQLEDAIDNMEKSLPPMKNFILPGGNNSISYCHIARCVCRRAERECASILEENEAPLIMKYVNRLSDFLFVLSRKWGKEMGIKEIPWKPRK